MFHIPAMAVILKVMIQGSGHGIQALKTILIGYSLGDFSIRLDIQTGDERDQVIQAFNEMVPKLQDHLRIYKSLNLATEVQQSLLPQANPKIPGLDIVGKSIYCDETGGDYFDYLEIGLKPPGRISVIVGDVADHGIPSALLMATARALIRPFYMIHLQIPLKNFAAPVSPLAWMKPGSMRKMKKPVLKKVKSSC